MGDSYIAETRRLIVQTIGRAVVSAGLAACTAWAYASAVSAVFHNLAAALPH